jgi:uncharacterized repeat protein (TIGR01451 family)
VAIVGAALGCLITGCGSTRLGGLEVSSEVVSNGATASTPNVPQGTEVEIQITVRNIGANSIGGVTVRVGVPTGFTYLNTVSTSTDGNSERSADIAPTSKEATLTWGAWAMGPGASGNRSAVVITADLKATGAPSSVKMSPLVFATGYVNTLSGTPLGLTIEAAPSLRVQLAVSPTDVAAGQMVTYQLVVTNTGSGQAPDTSIGVTLPDDFNYAGEAGSAGNASLSNATYPNTGTEIPTWTGIDVPGAGSSGPGSLSLSFTVLVLALVPDGTYTCSATLVASTGSQTQNYIQQNYTALAAILVTAA